MDYRDVLQKVLDLARNQFGTDADELDEQSTAAQVHAWNSLSHLLLVTSVEKAFHIKFDLVQMINMKSLGDLAKETSAQLK